jgi:hypothetical protein
MYAIPRLPIEALGHAVYYYEAYRADDIYTATVTVTQHATLRKENGSSYM